MAAVNLAVVNDNHIVIYADALNLSASVIERIPLGPVARTHPGYAECLRQAGWRPNGRWGWTPTQSGALPSVAVVKA